jgi:hypothetical protein
VSLTGSAKHTLRTTGIPYEPHPKILTRECCKNLCRELPFGGCKEISIFNPLKPKLVQIIFKNWVRTSKTTPHFTMININLLTLFKEIIAVYPEISTKPANKNADSHCQSSWYVYLPLGFKELMTTKTNSSVRLDSHCLYQPAAYLNSLPRLSTQTQAQCISDWRTNTFPVTRNVLLTSHIYVGRNLVSMSNISVDSRLRHMSTIRSKKIVSDAVTVCYMKWWQFLKRRWPNDRSLSILEWSGDSRRICVSSNCITQTN